MKIVVGGSVGAKQPSLKEIMTTLSNRQFVLQSYCAQGYGQRKDQNWNFKAFTLYHMDIYHCCYKCLIVWIDWTKVRIDLFKKLHHHTCLPFSSPPPRMGVLRVGKVALHNCSKVLRGEGQEIRCCCFFPGLTIIAEAPENFAEKTFQCFDRALACHHQILLFALSSKKRVSSPKMFNLLLYACVSTDYFWH